MTDFWLGFAFGCLVLVPAIMWLAIPYINMIRMERQLKKSISELEKTKHVDIDEDTKKVLKEADDLIKQCPSK